MSKKPYIYEDAEGWLQITKRKDWNDPKNNPNDLLPYSEFQKPYGKGRKRSYPDWEWSWPDDDLPPIDDVTYPDPVENDCSIDEDCIWAGVMGPGEMECGDCYTFTQAHLFLSCESAPWWAAFGSWTLDTQTAGGECYQLFTGPLMTTICCEEEAYGAFTVTYEGVLSCVAEVTVDVTCAEEDACCEELGLIGAATVNAGQTWVGTISPTCEGVECDVVSNSGCTLSCGLNPQGTEVSVATGGSDCGGFTVTVTHDPGGECEAKVASKFVRINGGTWALDKTSGELGMAGCTTCGWGGGSTYFPTTCYIGEHWYGAFDPVDGDCGGAASVQCKAEGVGNPCEDSPGVNICGWSFGGCGGWVNCAKWGWYRCKYVCECP